MTYDNKKLHSILFKTASKNAQLILQGCYIYKYLDSYELLHTGLTNNCRQITEQPKTETRTSQPTLNVCVLFLFKKVVSII